MPPTEAKKAPAKAPAKAAPKKAAAEAKPKEDKPKPAKPSKGERKPKESRPLEKRVKRLPKLARKLVVHKRTKPLWNKLCIRAKRISVRPHTLVKRKSTFVVKPIGGDKNGGKRIVNLKKEKRFYPTEPRPKRRRTGRVCYKHHKRSFKAGLDRGRVVILLAGRHRGKRVVVLKKLPSGMLLITGPHKINGCPLRRMHQDFTIVTSARLSLKGFTLPRHVNDKYFKTKRRITKKGEGDVFAKKKYKPSKVRKADQIAVDKQVIEAIRKHPEKKLMMAYVGSFFQLRNRMYPHKMKF